MNTIKLIKNKRAGQIFERVTILDGLAEYDGKNTKVLCRCECGSNVKVRLDSLVHGLTKSCGCLRRELALELVRSGTQHGKSRSRLYTTWANMISRCSNKSHANYTRYGGRGISVCEEWSEFIAFADWAVASGYQDALTIDRVNADGNYCPENCRWITQSENSKSTAKKIKRNDGKVFNNIHDMAAFYGIEKHAAYYRIQRNKPLADQYYHSFIKPQ